MSTWDLPTDVLASWERRQRLRTTTAEQKARETVKAANKASAPKVAGPSIWQTVWDWSPFGSKNVVTKAATDPVVAGALKAKDAVGGAFADLSGAIKWGVVGLVALAVIVAIPRLLPQR